MLRFAIISLIGPPITGNAAAAPDTVPNATANTIDYTLEAPLIVDGIYTITNSRSSTYQVQLLNPVNTITGIVVVGPGTDILLAPGDTISLVALTTTTLEVI